MSLATADTAPRAIRALAAADPEDAPAREIPPEITSAEHSAGASVSATLWMVFILYAASRGLG